MGNTNRSIPAAQSHWMRRTAAAAALVAAVGLGGCAGTPGFADSADAPYQVAGPVVENGPTHTQYRACENSQTFVDDCSGFPRFYLP